MAKKIEEDKEEIATQSLAVADTEPKQVAEEVPPAPRVPAPHDMVVFVDGFSGKGCTAFVQNVRRDGSIDLVALIIGEQSPAVNKTGVYYSKDKRPGHWHWVGE